MVDAPSLPGWPASLIVVIGLGSFFSLLAVPVFLFAGTLAAIDGSNPISYTLFATAFMSGFLAIGCPLSTLWMHKKQVNIRHVRYLAFVAVSPAFLAVPVLGYLFF
jgi:hypothetical protein